MLVEDKVYKVYLAALKTLRDNKFKAYKKNIDLFTFMSNLMNHQ